jgi:hypothetical protein
MKGLTGFHPTTFDAAGATQAARSPLRIHLSAIRF